MCAITHVGPVRTGARAEICTQRPMRRRGPCETMRAPVRYEAKDGEHGLLEWAGAGRTDEDGPTRAAAADGQPQPRPRRAGSAAGGGGRLPYPHPDLCPASEA